MKVKEFRIVLIAATVIAGLLLFQLIQKPTQAARQKAGAGTETAPVAGANLAENAGAESYAKHCAICHGDQREGILPGFPPLLGINHRMAENKIANLVHSGKGRMPGFPDLQNGELTALLRYLTSAEISPQTAGGGEKATEPSGLSGARRALLHQPCPFSPRPSPIPPLR